MIEPSGFKPEESNFVLKPVPSGWVIRFKGNNRAIPQRFAADYFGPGDPYDESYQQEPLLDDVSNKAVTKVLLEYRAAVIKNPKCNTKDFADRVIEAAGESADFFNYEPPVTPELAKRDAESWAMVLDKVLAIKEKPPVKSKNYNPHWLARLTL